MIRVAKSEGTPYDAPNHYGVYGVLKLTKETTQNLIVNYSFFHPNGGINMDSAPIERVYCITKGSVTIKGKGDEEHLLEAGDMIYIGAGEERSLTVNNGEAAEALVIVSAP